MSYAFRDGSLGAYYPTQPAESNGVGSAEDFNAGLRSLLPVIALIGATTGAYHGYKRNESVGWAVAWGLLGGVFPFVTLPVSLAQGFGERKRG